MRKIIGIIVIVMIILTCGCINKQNSENKNYPNAKTEDLTLEILLSNNVIQKNNTSMIIVTAKLKNINNETSINVLKTFDFHSNIYGELTTPSNISYDIGTKTDIHPVGTKIELKHNEKIKTSIQMNELIYFIENKQGYNWSEVGTHKMQFWYTSVQPYVYSNVVSLIITK